MLPGMSVEHSRRRLAAPKRGKSGRQSRPRSSLCRLAEASGIQTVYLDVNGRPVRASSETLQKLLDAVGFKAGEPQPEAVNVLDTVTVAWEGRASMRNLPLPKQFSCQKIHTTVHL